MFGFGNFCDGLKNSEVGSADQNATFVASRNPRGLQPGDPASVQRHIRFRLFDVWSDEPNDELLKGSAARYIVDRLKELGLQCDEMDIQHLAFVSSVVICVTVTRKEFDAAASMRGRIIAKEPQCTSFLNGQGSHGMGEAATDEFNVVVTKIACLEYARFYRGNVDILKAVSTWQHGRLAGGMSVTLRVRGVRTDTNFTGRQALIMPVRKTSLKLCSQTSVSNM